MCYCSRCPNTRASCTESAEKPQGAPVLNPMGLISKTFLLGVLSSGLSHVKRCSVSEAYTTSASLWVFQRIRSFFSDLIFSYCPQFLKRHRSLNKRLLTFLPTCFQEDEETAFEKNYTNPLATSCPAPVHAPKQS